MQAQLLAVSQDYGQDCCQAVSVSLFYITTRTGWGFFVMLFVITYCISFSSLCEFGQSKIGRIQDIGEVTLFDCLIKH